MAKKTVWNSFRIQEALAERGLNLTSLAKREGLWPSACREAVSSSGNTRGQHAISRALGVPVWELFPHKFAKPSDASDHSRNARGADSPKRSEATSAEEAAA